MGLGVAAPGSVGRREQAGERWAVCVFLTPRPPGPSSLLCDVGRRNRESLGKK